ncbi:uncharacterized protein CANTADRAFT_107539 [Suhomyces tanzawaensis NRRL Y-17324]|uniref:Uncharacterized protein n=1 Tax=Suhomyces tanzawaensis NRRL Y-17324 TaxID=984487 RepID=A0A1E4SPH0_9ASCO|nr:uncharacterized protein CANTADRAFT_107539 [Suhomyces tanzawaensis NRRL Y-17324]ODV81419.1 hypothetical protein CANTADRAFT_107539 [Suhomyces tanzawaensis NRRL Y-17324]
MKHQIIGVIELEHWNQKQWLLCSGLTYVKIPMGIEFLILAIVSWNIGMGRPFDMLAAEGLDIENSPLIQKISTFSLNYSRGGCSVNFRSKRIDLFIGSDHLRMHNISVIPFQVHILCRLG